MVDESVLVFVEVRHRRAGRFASAAVSVHATKQRRLILAASQFLRLHPDQQERTCRFDVFGVDLQKNGSVQVDWRRDAFRPE